MRIIRCLMFWRQCPACKYLARPCFDDVRRGEYAWLR